MNERGTKHYHMTNVAVAARETTSPPTICRQTHRQAQGLTKETSQRTVFLTTPPSFCFFQHRNSSYRICFVQVFYCVKCWRILYRLFKQRPCCKPEASRPVVPQFSSLLQGVPTLPTHRDLTAARPRSPSQGHNREATHCQLTWQMTRFFSQM